MNDRARSTDDLIREARRLAEEREYARVADLLEPQDRAELVAEPVLGFLLAEAWHRRGDLDRALPLLAAVVPECLRRGNDSLYRESLNLQGVVLFGAGDVNGAEDAWSRLVEAATSAGDENLLARVHNNFGVVYTLRGDRERALASYGRATAAYQRLSYLRGLAQAHNNLGITYREIDFFADAEHHFQQALSYAREDKSADEEARATTERAVLLTYRRDLRLARATAGRALAMWNALGDSVGEGEGHRVLAMVAAAESSWQTAEEEATRARELASRSHAPLLEAEALELQALVAARTGRESEAEADRLRAGEIFAAIGAEGWGRLVRLRTERLPPSSTRHP